MKNQYDYQQIPQQPYYPPQQNQQNYSQQNQYNQQQQQPQQQPTGEENANKYRDPVFAIIFLVHLMGIFYLAINEYLLSGDKKSVNVSTNGIHGEILIPVILSAVFACIFSFLWITFMIKRAKDIITCSIMTSIIFFAVAAGIAFLFAGPIPALIFGLMSVFTWVWYTCVKKDIPFASECLKTACTAIDSYYHVISVAFAALFFSIMYQIVLGFAALGLANRLKETSAEENDVNVNVNSDSSVYTFCLVLSLFWTLQVISNVVHTTVSGVTASWWFLNSEKGVVSGSLKRSLTTSFGSICMGSLLVALIETVKSMRNANSKKNCVVNCILHCIERFLKYFTRWAFCFVGIYGTPFIESGKRVFELFTQKGYTALLNDYLIERALNIGVLMVACLTGAVGSGLAVVFDFSIDGVDQLHANIGMGLLSALMGGLICTIMMNVIQSATMTVLVCFVDDPQALSTTHPQSFQSMNAAFSVKFSPSNRVF